MHTTGACYNNYYNTIPHFMVWTYLPNSCAKRLINLPFFIFCPFLARVLVNRGVRIIDFQSLPIVSGSESYFLSLGSESYFLSRSNFLPLNG